MVGSGLLKPEVLSEATEQGGGWDRERRSPSSLAPATFRGDPQVVGESVAPQPGPGPRLHGWSGGARGILNRPWAPTLVPAPWAWALPGSR